MGVSKVPKPNPQKKVSQLAPNDTMRSINKSTDILNRFYHTLVKVYDFKQKSNDCAYYSYFRDPSNKLKNEQ